MKNKEKTVGSFLGAITGKQGRGKVSRGSHKPEVGGSSPPPASSLNERQKKFAQEYIKDFNGAQAAIRAGYSKRSAKVMASQLLTHPNVSAYLQTLKDSAAERNKVEVDEIIRNAREIYAVSMGKQAIRVTEVVKNSQEGTATPVDVDAYTLDPRAANSANETLGKIAGVFIDRKDITSKGQQLASGVLVVPAEQTEEEWEGK